MKHSRPGSRPKLGSLKQRIQAKQSETKEIRLQQPVKKAPPTQRKTSQQLLREMVGNLAESDDGVVVDNLPMEQVLKSAPPNLKPTTKTKPLIPQEPDDLLGGLDLDKLPSIDDETHAVEVEALENTPEQVDIEAQEDALEISPSAHHEAPAEPIQEDGERFAAWDMDPDEFEAGIISDDAPAAPQESVTSQRPATKSTQKPAASPPQPTVKNSPPARGKSKAPPPAPVATPQPVQDDSPFELTDEHIAEDDDPFTVSEAPPLTPTENTDDLPFSLSESFIEDENQAQNDTVEAISEESLAAMNTPADDTTPQEKQSEHPAAASRPSSKIQRASSKIGQRPTTKSVRPATTERATKSTKGLERPKEGGMPVWMIYSMAGATLVMIILLVVMGTGKLFGDKTKKKDIQPVVVNEYEEFGFAKKDFMAAKTKFERAKILLNNHKYREALPLLEESHSGMQNAIERANTVLNKYEATSGGNSDVDNFKTDVAEWGARSLRPCWQQLELCKRHIEEMESSASGMTAEQIDKLYEKSVALTDEAFPLFQEGTQARMSGNFTAALEKLQQALDKFKQAVQEADTVLTAHPTAKHSAHNDWKELVSTCESQLQKARNGDPNP